MTIVASAPGKIVLSGEYAVLDGAPAICMAVDRRAVATVSKSADGDCHLVTPGFDGADPFGIVDAVCGGIRPALDIELDTSAFFQGRRKVGIGSSAALTVALVAALEHSEDVFVKALLAHSELQGGKGSGIDVAAAVHGGLIEYRSETRSVNRLDWPADLNMRVLWMGVSASTQEKLDKLAQSAGERSRSDLGRAAASVADAWKSGRADRILAELVPYVGVLRRFSVDHDLGIFDAGHDELTGAAMADGLVYKPAGAGGGDIGVLFGCSDDEVDEFIDRHRDLVHAVVPCRLDPAGVSVEQV